MDAMWEDDEPFSGFGPDPLNPHAPRGMVRVEPPPQWTSLPQGALREQVRQACPRTPGVYGMLDSRGRLIYVGKSKGLRGRLLSYFNPASAAEKPGRIIEATRALLWETQPSEFAALLREQQLIRRWTPRWNVQEIPRRRRPVYLCLGRPPAPYFYLSRTPVSPGALAIEGPLHGAGRMGQAVEALNHFFRLRDCSSAQPLRFAEQLPLFDLEHRPGCLRHEIGTCLGPCAAGCSRGQYDQQVAAARSFLEGCNNEPLVEVREQMESAAARCHYERAARLRDDLAALEYLHRKLRMLADARRRYNFVYAVHGFDGCHSWYLIRSGEVADVVAAPRCPETYRQLRPRIRQWDRETAPAPDGNAGRYAHTLTLVAGWFRRYGEQLESTFPPAQAGRRYRRLVRPPVSPDVPVR